MKYRYTPHPSGVPPVIFWNDGNVHVDGREFGPTRESDRKVTAEENAAAFIKHHYGGTTVSAAFAAGSDFRQAEQPQRGGRR